MASTVVSNTVWSAEAVIKVEDQPWESEAQLRLAYKCMLEGLSLLTKVRQRIERSVESTTEKNQAIETYNGVLRDIKGDLEIFLPIAP